MGRSTLGKASQGSPVPSAPRAAPALIAETCPPTLDKQGRHVYAGMLGSLLIPPTSRGPRRAAAHCSAAAGPRESTANYRFLTWHRFDPGSCTCLTEELEKLRLRFKRKCRSKSRISRGEPTGRGARCRFVVSLALVVNRNSARFLEMVSPSLSKQPHQYFGVPRMGESQRGGKLRRTLRRLTKLLV